jgi:predicted nuclease of predicted toxin-antitoxin system
MIFYLDEDVNVELATFLQIQSHEARTTARAGNQGNEDEDQLDYATQRSAVLITHNRRHFRRLHRDWMLASKHHAGIILTRQLPLSELERRMKAFLIFAFGLDMAGMLFDLRDFA